MGNRSGIALAVPRRWNLDAATQAKLSDQKCSHAAGCDPNDHGLRCSLGEHAGNRQDRRSGYQLN